MTGRDTCSTWAERKAVGMCEGTLLAVVRPGCELPTLPACLPACPSPTSSEYSTVGLRMLVPTLFTGGLHS